MTPSWLSSRQVLALALTASCLMLGACSTGATDAADHHDTVMDTAQVGDCFTGERTQLRPIECSQEHSTELIARETHDSTDIYPGDVELETTSIALCKKTLSEKYPHAAESQDFSLQVANPTKEAWNAGQHEYLCFVEWNQDSIHTVAEVFGQ